jgi:hypothetical protein
MKYADEMGSSAAIYIPSFIKIGSGIRNLMRVNSQTHRQDGDRISVLQESRLITPSYDCGSKRTAASRSTKC